MTLTEAPSRSQPAAPAARPASAPLLTLPPITSSAGVPTPAEPAVAGATPVADAAMRPPVPALYRPSWFRRVLDALAFWRITRDEMFFSVLAPPVLYTGDSASLPLFAHRESADTIVAMGQTYFPSHRLVSTTSLRRTVPRGTRLVFQVALAGMVCEPPVQKIAWRGELTPLAFTVAVPPDYRPGEIVGVVSVGANADVILTHEFRVTIDRRHG